MEGNNGNNSIRNGVIFSNVSFTNKGVGDLNGIGASQLNMERMEENKGVSDLVIVGPVKGIFSEITDCDGTLLANLSRNKGQPHNGHVSRNRSIGTRGVTHHKTWKKRAQASPSGLGAQSLEDNLVMKSSMA